MPKRAVHLVCNEEELNILNKLINGRKTQKKLVERAKIILLCQAGLRNDEIAKKMQITAITVAKWRNRFSHYRIVGLNDKSRSGKPRKYDDSIRDAILKLIEKPAPDGQLTWSGELVSQKLGISHDVVWRILRKEGIRLQRIRRKQ